MDKLSIDQKKALIADCIKKYQQKTQYQNLYSTPSFNYLSLIIVRALISEKYAPFLLKIQENKQIDDFNKSGYWISPAMLNEIMSSATNFLNEN
ncbi:MAG TPA: hypothetical protein PKD03_10170 [Ignavibacteriaceae bacterium]|nr:hypothetical protein [Ignavibacteriaceae bacterium]